jgi:hypothetical protein
MKSNCLFILFLVAPLYGGVVADGLKQIPMHDRLLMRQFVELNVKLHQASHVIYFDNKPVSLASVWIKSPKRLFADVMWIKGWRAFKKHEHLFPHPNFIFNLEIYEEDTDWKSASLFIINKRALNKCLIEHSRIFQKILGQDFNFEWFISQLESGNGVTSLINNNEMLLGLLLGFGEASCSTYQEMRNNYKGTIPPHTEEYCPIDVKSPNMRKLLPIGFMGNPTSKEVQSLVSLYECELNAFWNSYKKEDPLVFFLECICEENNLSCTP